MVNTTFMTSCFYCLGMIALSHGIVYAAGYCRTYQNAVGSFLEHA
jgi:hypothetical protein